jgi:hypothetical protein
MTIAFPLLRREEPPEPAPPQAPVTPEPQPEAVPAPQEEGDMGTLEQCVAIVRHAFRVARRRSKDLAEKEGGWVNGLLAAKPPSVNEQREYLRNRAWLPPGHEDGIADQAGRWYHRLVGVPGVAVGNAISATFARPFRLIAALTVLAAVIALVWVAVQL